MGNYHPSVWTGRWNAMSKEENVAFKVLSCHVVCRLKKTSEKLKVIAMVKIVRESFTEEAGHQSVYNELFKFSQRPYFQYLFACVYFLSSFWYTRLYVFWNKAIFIIIILNISIPPHVWQSSFMGIISFDMTIVLTISYYYTGQFYHSCMLSLAIGFLFELVGVFLFDFVFCLMPIHSKYEIWL